MAKIIQKIKDNKIETLFITIVLVIFVILTIDVTPKESEEKTEKKSETSQTATKVKVDIKGAVNNPGVFEMEADARVIDVIAEAGGLTEEADTSLINLSKKVEDEMVITIYTQAQIEAMEEECPPCECPEINDACTLEEDEAQTTESKDTSTSATPTGKISINTATSEQLQTLDGIGEAKAEAIIGYRETNGTFKDIEEIKNVSGIGDAIYEKIKDDITV